MAIFNLTALPSHHEQDHGRPYKMTVVELLGTVLGRTRIEAKNLPDIAAFVKTFGADVAKQNPEKSFMVSTSVAKGSRKPNGFDDADKRHQLGQEAWMKTVYKGGPANAEAAT